MKIKIVVTKAGEKQANGKETAAPRRVLEFEIVLHSGLILSAEGTNELKAKVEAIAVDYALEGGTPFTTTVEQS